MSEDGFEDRKEYVKDAKIIKEWDYNMELALRSENQLFELLKGKVFTDEMKGLKYANLTQLVSSAEAYEDVDIKVPGVCHIEVKGHNSAYINFNKFTHLAKIYVNNKGKGIYATARGVTNKDNKQLVDTKDENVFDSFDVHVIPDGFMKAVASHLPTFLNLNQDQQSQFMEFVVITLGYKTSSFENPFTGKVEKGYTLPPTKGISISNTSNGEDIKDELIKRRNDKKMLGVWTTVLNRWLFNGAKGNELKNYIKTEANKPQEFDV
jgi:hypothetical protein